MKLFSVSEEGGQVPLPHWALRSDGIMALCGGCQSMPSLANPIQGHTEHVQELCKAGGEGSGIDSGGELFTPCFL